MKLVKLLAAASVLAAGLCQSVFANTNETNTIYVTGSSAFRKAAVAAIIASYDSAPTQINDSANTTSEANNTNNTTFLFVGTMNSVANTYVMCTFTGSVSGVWAVAGSKTIPFLYQAAATTYASTPTLAPSAYTASDSDSGSVNSNASINPTCTPDIAFSDVFQGSTIYSNSSVVNTDDGSSSTYKTLTDTVVGIPTFKWIASAGFPVGTQTSPKSSYSVTSRFANYVLGNGVAQLSFMTGNTTDQNTEIYAVGRNPDSGTRLTALIDTNYGATKPVVQYNQTGLSGSAVTGLQLWPASAGYVAGDSVLAGNNGAGSGADLRPYASYTIPTSASVTGKNPTACYFIMYLGLSDATTVEAQGVTSSAAGPGIELYYNGVQYSDQAIRNGQYSFWSYEHCMHRSTGFTTPASTLYSRATSYLTNAANVSTINALGAGYSIADPAMLVKRATDGAVILPASNFPY